MVAYHQVFVGPVDYFLWFQIGVSLPNQIRFCDTSSDSFTGTCQFFAAQKFRHQRWIAGFEALNLNTKKTLDMNFLGGLKWDNFERRPKSRPKPTSWKINRVKNDPPKTEKKYLTLNLSPFKSDFKKQSPKIQVKDMNLNLLQSSSMYYKQMSFQKKNVNLHVDLITNKNH